MKPGDVRPPYPVGEGGRVGHIGEQILAHTGKDQDGWSGNDHEDEQGKGDAHIDIAEQFDAAIKTAKNGQDCKPCHHDNKQDLDADIGLKAEQVS